MPPIGRAEIPRRGSDSARNAPYFTEEDNWTDDMQLAAAELYARQANATISTMPCATRTHGTGDAFGWARTVHVHEWYPFVNIGHYLLSNVTDAAAVSKEFRRNLRTGIERVSERGKAIRSSTAFQASGAPTNRNAMITQCRLYRETTGDPTLSGNGIGFCATGFFGCNPAGNQYGGRSAALGRGYARTSAFVVCGEGIGYVPGALIDGPVYATIFTSLAGHHAARSVQPFSGTQMVYHDDVNDYSTNELTMDGTGASPFLSAPERGRGTHGHNRPQHGRRRHHPHRLDEEGDPAGLHRRLTNTMAKR